MPERSALLSVGVAHPLGEVILQEKGLEAPRCVAQALWE